MSAIKLLTTANKKVYESSGITLNDSQSEAVMHNKGPLLIQAGPGSGKSTVLAAKIQYLLTVKSVRPHRIMAITFTRKAAGELKERINKLPHITSGEINSLAIGTFHSIFLRILRAAGLKHEILASDNQKESMINSILKDQGLREDYSPEIMLAELSYLKNIGLTTKELNAETGRENEWLGVIKAYEGYKREKKLLDFDDILLETKKLLEIDEYLLSGLQGQFEHILIDEFQDINQVQLEAVKMISAPKNNVCAVGDVNQSIFGFRAASTRYIKEFREHFPGAVKITLDKNYRSTKRILGLANRVIKHTSCRAENIAVREGKSWPVYMKPADPEEEARQIVELIEEKHHKEGTPLKSFAVLYRTVENSRALFEKLTLEGIPFICYNNRTPFYETDCIKPVIDYLRLAAGKSGMEALLGVLHTLYLSRMKWAKQLQEMHKSSPSTPLIRLLLGLPSLESFQRESLKKRIQLVESLGDKQPIEAIRLIRQQFYDKYINRSFLYPLSHQKEQLFEKLDELKISAAKFDRLEGYVEFVDLVVEKHKEMQSLMEEPDQQDRVKLMTIHSSKGLEFDTVFVIGVVEDNIPHRNALNEGDNHIWHRFLIDKELVDDPVEEECRLLYVAVTRAKENLFISGPKNYKNKPVKISRFIQGFFK